MYDDNNISIDTGLGNYGGGGLLLHLAHTVAHSYDAKQIFYPNAGMKNTYLERVKDTDKGWQPWEYVNPPMAPGKEYRTTERQKGKAVYKKLDTDGVIKWRLDGETTWKAGAEYAGAASTLLTAKTLHVAKTGSDTIGDGSEAKPFLTINAALGSLPKLLMGNVTITVHEGTYDESVYVSGFSGNGDLEIKGESGKTVSVRTFYIHDNACGSTKLTNLTVFGSSGDGYNWSVFCDKTTSVFLTNIICTNTVASQYYGAFRFTYLPFATLSNVTISNKPIAIDVCAATVYLRDAITGTGNKVAIRCGSAWGKGGGIVQKGECSLAGEEQKGFGGQIW